MNTWFLWKASCAAVPALAGCAGRRPVRLPPVRYEWCGLERQHSQGWWPCFIEPRLGSDGSTP